ncbi:unnamed protein product [Pleuronectes platessa]|uniref:Uncharacterized protein n=1 Tax=Pleuronectes platessa TaxID=8262 RepID=A0A9N7Z9A6_PLEPL|nr:unnamed protein product [Pleuronectes platessa]
MKHSAGDTDCSPEGITIRLLFVPRINFQTVAASLGPVEHVTPERKQDYAPKSHVPLHGSPLPLELRLWSGGLRVEAGAQLNKMMLTPLDGGKNGRFLTEEFTDLGGSGTAKGEMGLFFSSPLHNAAYPIKEPPDPFVGGGEWTSEGGRHGEGERERDGGMEGERARAANPLLPTLSCLCSQPHFTAN